MITMTGKMTTRTMMTQWKSRKTSRTTAVGVLIDKQKFNEKNILCLTTLCIFTHV